MIKGLTIIPGFLLAYFLYGQSSASLSEQLWKRAKSCDSQIEDFDEDGKKDYEELVDDAKNGYLRVAGGWPTCGCSCSESIGAYKGSSGNYTILEKEEWNCKWISQISSNRDLNEVFPENFGILSFIENENINLDGKDALFYLDIEIPRVGTSTKVQIKLIPFGMHLESNNLLAFGFSKNEDASNCKMIYSIGTIARNAESEQTIDLLIKEQFDKISIHDMDIIKEKIGANNHFESINEVSKYLKELKEIYNLYSNIAHESLILGWDREKERFFIQEKGSRSPSISFRDFLIHKTYWMPIC